MRIGLRRTVCALAAALALVCQPSPAQQVLEPDGADMMVDVVVTRPLGLLALVVGTAVFVVALPFTVPSGSVAAAAEELVKKPARYTFRRPLGVLEYCSDPDCRY